MKKLIFSFLLISSMGFAQNYNTGDKELDNVLQSVNTEATKDIKAAKERIAKAFEVSSNEVEECFTAGMNAGDAFMAANLSRTLKVPMERVIKSFQVNKTKGWGAIAKDLGIKPGSPEFHALKGKAKTHSHGGQHTGSASNGKKPHAKPHQNNGKAKSNSRKGGRKS